MFRTCSLALLLLCGCDRTQRVTEADWDNVRQDADIETLKRQISDLQKLDDLRDKELSALENGQAALTDHQSALQNQVNGNAKIANDTSAALKNAIASNAH